jgi:hypothetical protein
MEEVVNYVRPALTLGVGPTVRQTPCGLGPLLELAFNFGQATLQASNSPAAVITKRAACTMVLVNVTL